MFPGHLETFRRLSCATEQAGILFARSFGEIRLQRTTKWVGFDRFRLVSALCLDCLVRVSVSGSSDAAFYSKLVLR